MPMLELPEDKKELATTCRMFIDAGVQTRNLHCVEWLLNHYYMQGARGFTDVDFVNGTLKAHFENQDGELQYRYERILKQFRDELGRRLKMDVRPVVDRSQDFSLDGIRRATAAQLTLDTLLSDIDLDEIKKNAIIPQLMYGTLGIACWGETNRRVDRVQGVMEIVPPWQLLPIPANPNLAGDVQGLIRYRPVPKAWIKLRMQKDPANQWPKDESLMKTRKVRIGTQADPVGSLFQGNTDAWIPPVQADSPADANKAEKKPSAAAQEVEYGDLAEVFVHNDDGTLDRYVVWFAGVVVKDVSYREDPEPPMKPIEVARDIEAGGFYGRSMVSLLRPTNMEVEYLLRQMFENAADLDMFGILMLPTTMGIRVDQLKATGKPRYAFYEPDLTVPEHKPFAIQPHNTGDWPGKVAQLGISEMEALAGSSPMQSGRAPGRVDSASGLGFLYETASISLGAPLLSLAHAFSSCWRALLGIARESWTETTLARLTQIDDTLVGIRMDGATGKIQLDSQSIPHPRDVKISVKSQTPVSLEQRKQEAIQLLQMKDASGQPVMTAKEFRRQNLLLGLGYPLDGGAEWESYRKAMLNNIILFGDGETPGEVVDSIEGDMHEVALEIVQRFMAKPEFTLASTEVKNAFADRKKFHLQQLSPYPQQAIYPEDAAAAQQQQMEAMGGMGGGPGSGGQLPGMGMPEGM